MNYSNDLEKCTNIQEIFQLVKLISNKYFGKDQAGLLIGLSDLGSSKNAYLGAYYSLNANTIVINKRPLEILKKSNPHLWKPYAFHILLHEYIHSLGFMNEEEVRILALQISIDYFGEEHITSKMASNISKFIPNFTYGDNFEEPDDLNIDFLIGIDKKNTNYIM